MINPQELSKRPTCQEIALNSQVICGHSEYGQYAIKHHFAAVWCGMACCGEYRAYLVEDSERHWVWAKSPKQIKEYWLTEYEDDSELVIRAISYGEASKTVIGKEENDNKTSLIDIILNEYRDVKEIHVIASTVW